MSTFTTYVEQPQPDGAPPAPPPRKPAVIAAAVAVAVLLSAFGILEAVGTVYERDWRTSSSYPAADLRGIVVNASAGDVKVVTTDGPEVVVHRRVAAAWSAPKATAQTSGGLLRLSDDCPGWLFGHCQVSYEIMVPADFSVEADSGAGDVEMDGLRGPVAISSGAGDVEIRDFRGTDLEAESSAGNIEVECGTTPTSLQAITSAGDIVVELPDGSGPYDVTTTTDVGDASSDVRADPAAPNRVTAVTSAGDVTVRYS